MDEVLSRLGSIEGSMTDLATAVKPAMKLADDWSRLVTALTRVARFVAWGVGIGSGAAVIYTAVNGGGIKL